MASRRKSTTPVMVLPREALDSDQDMEDLTEEAEDADHGGTAAANVPVEGSGGLSVSGGAGPRAAAGHYADSNGAAEGGYECKYCSFRTAELNLFTLHVDTAHPDIVVNSSYVCVACDFHTKRYDALLEHNARHHPGEDSFTRTMVRRNNQTVFEQTVNDLTFDGSFVKMEEEEEEVAAAEEEDEDEETSSCRGIALSQTPIMRIRGRAEPKKYVAKLADVIKAESEEEEEEEEEESEDREEALGEPPTLSPAPIAPRIVTVSAPIQVQHLQQQSIMVNSPNVLQFKTTGSGAGMLAPGTLAQVLSALQNQHNSPLNQHTPQTQLLIPLSSIPTYNNSMDNNVLLVSAYNRFPYPSVSEIMGLSSQTKFSEEQIKVWFSAQRLKHGVSWTPEEVEEARRKKFNGTVQAVPQTITVIPANIAAATNGLHSIFQTCQIVGQSGLVLTQVGGAGNAVPVGSPITLTMAGVPSNQAKAAEPSTSETKTQAGLSSSSAAAQSPDSLGTKPKKSKEQLGELKASYLTRQFATEAEISRLMRVTGLTKRAIKKWFSDTRYNQRNSKDHHGGAPCLASPGGGGGGAAGGGGSHGNAAASGGGGPAHPHGAAIVIDSSDDAGDCSPTSAGAPGSASDPRVKFRHAFPDFTPQKFKEKTPEQVLVLEASYQTSATPADEELSRLRSQTKLTRREVDAWFTERRKTPAAEPRDPGDPPDGDRGQDSQATTPPSSRKILKKTPEQLHVLKSAFVRTQWPTSEEYDRMAEDSGLPRTYIVNWFGDTRYACKNSNLKWYYLYQSGKVDEALNGGTKTPKKPRKRFRGWSRRTRRPYPCKRSSPGTPPIKAKTGGEFLKEHYLKHRVLNEKDLDELVSKSSMSYEQVRDWFTQVATRVEEGREAFSDREGDGEEAGEEEEVGEEEEEEEEEEGEEEEEEETEEAEATRAESDGEMEVRETREEAQGDGVRHPEEEEGGRGEEDGEEGETAEEELCDVTPSTAEAPEGSGELA